MEAHQKLLFRLPSELVLDLDALSEAHYGAPKVRLVKEAIKAFIDAQLKSEPSLRDRFNQARQDLSADGAGAIRLVDRSEETL